MYLSPFYYAEVGISTKLKLFLKQPKQLKQIDKEKAIDWMNKGAQPSNIVSKIFMGEGLKHKSIIIKKFPERPSKAEMKKVPTSAKAESGSRPESVGKKSEDTPPTAQESVVKPKEDAEKKPKEDKSSEKPEQKEEKKEVPTPSKDESESRPGPMQDQPSDQSVEKSVGKNKKE